MASKLTGRVSRLELSRPTPLVPPVILDTDTPEQATAKYKMLVQMGGAIKAPVEVSEMTEAQASELYYAAAPYARRESVPVVVVNAEGPHAPISVSDDQSDAWAWLDDADTWEAAHPDGPAYADRHGMPAPEEYAHVPAELREALDLPPIDEQPGLLHCREPGIDEQPEPPTPLVAMPISDEDDDWLIL